MPPMSEALDLLIAELEQLPRRSRRAILEALLPEERARLLAGGSGSRGNEADDTRRLSPWLASRVAQARNPAAMVPPNERLTAAARQKLIECIAAAASGAPPPAAARAGDPGSRSLTDAVGGLLSSRRTRA